MSTRSSTATRHSSSAARSCTRERRVDALRPRQREHGARLLLRLGDAREDAPKGVAVVADLHPAVALEAREADAVAGGDLEVRRERRLGRLARRVAGRGALRQPVGEAAERVERLDAGAAGSASAGRGLEVGGGEADAERLAARPTRA